MATEKYILIHEKSLYRAENRYRDAYGYRKVAQRHADKINQRAIADAARWPSRYDETHDTVIVVGQTEYAEMIKGKGSWKTNLRTGGRIWVEFDCAPVNDPSTELYHSF